jgi:GNAT superfamily N-acetyltransferase
MLNSLAAPAPELRDFVDLAFARRLELAETVLPDCVEALRGYDPAAPIAAENIAGGSAFFGGVTYPANQIVGLGLYGEVKSNDLDRVEGFFRSRGVPSAIVVSPLADASLPALLAPRGYRISEFNSVLIRQIDLEETGALPSGIEVERITPETSATWARVVAQGFSEFGPVSDDVFAGFGALPGALAFVARLEGKIVGGCGGRIVPEAKIASLFGTATLPDFRPRGVQSALIARRLKEAVKAGCEYAVVSTLPGSGSQRNMERRGFRVAYTKLVMMREWTEHSNG